jgi:O-acetylhomoserine (thiol)-lyase
MSDQQKFETRLVHGAIRADKHAGPAGTPIVQASTFAYQTAAEIENVFAGRAPGFTYSRISNPTIDELEQRINSLEEGLGTVACSSGMAAITSTFLTLASAGDEIITSQGLFSGTWNLLKETLKRFGIETHFVDACNLAEIEGAINDKTRLIFVESIGNPKLDVPDLEAISKIAKAHGIVFAVDSTITSPFLLQSKNFGANLCLHSTTKLMNGHGNALGGSVTDLGNFEWNSPRYPHLKTYAERFRQFAFLAFFRKQVHQNTGDCLSPMNAFLTLTGLESLAVRQTWQCQSAQKIAEHFKDNPNIICLRYPGLQDHPNYDVVQKQFAGVGASVLTLELRDKKTCFEFIDALRIIKNATNLGDARTLAIHPASTFSRELSPEDKIKNGVTEGLIRFSIGLEHPDDLINDIETALLKISTT